MPQQHGVFHMDLKATVGPLQQPGQEGRGTEDHRILEGVQVNGARRRGQSRCYCQWCREKVGTQEPKSLPPFSLLLSEQLSALWADPRWWRKQDRRGDTDGRMDGWKGREEPYGQSMHIYNPRKHCCQSDQQKTQHVCAQKMLNYKPVTLTKIVLQVVNSVTKNNLQ